MTSDDDIDTPVWKFVLAALAGMLLITCCLIFAINAATRRLFEFTPPIVPTPTLQPLPRTQGTLEIVGNPAQNPVVSVRGRNFRAGERVELFFARNETEPYTQWVKFAEAVGEERVRPDGTFTMNFVNLPRELLVSGLLIAREAGSGAIANPVSFAGGVAAQVPGNVNVGLPAAASATPQPATATRPAGASVVPATNTPVPVAGPVATPTLAPFAPGAWLAEYWRDRFFTGAPAVRRGEADVNFNWLQGSPDPAIPADNWAAKFSKQIEVPASENYQFELSMDDGARLYVDEELVIANQWYEGQYRTAVAGKFLRAGRHTVRVEYFEASGYAAVGLKFGPNYRGWKGVYFNSPNHEGTPVLVRDDEKIDFAWGFFPPGPGVFPDGFSVDWTRTINFPSSGPWQFTVNADDGVRVMVDGQMVIDEFGKTGLSVVRGVANLTQGEHKVTVHYNDRSGNAQIKLDYGPFVTPGPTDTPAPAPTATQVPPTNTAQPAATTVPASATPPPPTATSVPPTATAVPATATTAPEPQPTPAGPTATFAATPVPIPTSRP